MHLGSPAVEHVDVVVVGAGLAGLTAARRLTQAGRTVAVLEARERVGGRTLNHTFANGAIVELGGQWVGPTQDRVLALLAELGIATFPTFDRGDNLVVLGEHRAPKRFKGDTFGLPPHVLADVGVAQRRLESMAKISAARRAVASGQGGSMGRRDGRELDPPQPPHLDGTRLLAPRGERRLLV